MTGAVKSELICMIDNLHVVASTVHTGEHPLYVNLRMGISNRKIQTIHILDQDLRSGCADLYEVPKPDVVIGVLGWFQALALGFGMEGAAIPSLRTQDVEDLSKIFPSLGKPNDLRVKMDILWQQNSGIEFIHNGQQKTVNKPSF